MWIETGFVLLGVVAIGLGGWAWRGRRIDLHPICRRCGYDLNRLEALTTACPECGAAITAPGAIRHGNRRRRSAALFTASMLMFVAVGGLGVRTYLAFADVAWVRYKPFAWALSDAIASAGTPGDINLAEMRRRYDTAALKPAQVDDLVDAALTVQGDRSIAWPNDWAVVLNDLIAAQELTQADVQRYFSQGLRLEFHHKPTVRRGRSLSLDLDAGFDRLTEDTRFKGARSADVVRIGESQVVRSGSFQGDTGGYVTSRFGSGYTMAITLGPMTDVPDGPTRLTTTFRFDLELVEPAPYAPVTIARPIDQPITVVGTDAIVDDFETDAAKRLAMAQSWTQTRVETHDGELKVWLRIEEPPVGLSMGVWLKQEARAWRVGSLRLDEQAEPAWHEVAWVRGAALPEEGPVTVELRPDQAPADSERQIKTYWGQALTRSGIRVNAPYEVPYNRDVSLAGQIEKSIYVTRVSAEGGKRPRISASLQAAEPPVRVSYRVRVRTGDRWIATTSAHLNARPGDHTGYTTGSIPLPDPDARTADILFIPNDDWQNRSSDATPPWGYPILFENVPLPRTDQGEQPTGPIHGRALTTDTWEQADAVQTNP